MYITQTLYFSKLQHTRKNSCPIRFKDDSNEEYHPRNECNKDERKHDIVLYDSDNMSAIRTTTASTTTNIISLAKVMYSTAAKVAENIIAAEQKHSLTSANAAASAKSLNKNNQLQN